MQRSTSECRLVSREGRHSREVVLTVRFRGDGGQSQSWDRFNLGARGSMAEAWPLWALRKKCSVLNAGSIEKKLQEISVGWCGVVLAVSFLLTGQAPWEGMDCQEAVKESSSSILAWAWWAELTPVARWRLCDKVRFWGPHRLSTCSPPAAGVGRTGWLTRAWQSEHLQWPLPALC